MSFIIALCIGFGCGYGFHDQIKAKWDEMKSKYWPGK